MSETYLPTSLRAIWPYCIWFVSVMCLLFQFLLQFSSGMMVGQLTETFHLTAARAGFLAGSYYHIYVLLQTPAGFLTDRLGPRKLLAGGAIVCALGCVGFSHASTFLQAEIGRLFMGGGLSFAFVGMVYITATTLPASQFSFMIGLAEMLAILGTLVSELYLASYLGVVGWRFFINMAALVACVLAALCWLFIPSKQEDHVVRDVLSSRDVFQQFIELVKKPVAWANGIYAGFLFAVLTTFHGLWAQPFLMKAYGLSLQDSAHYCSLMLLGALFGFPCAGWLGGMLRETKWLLVIAAITEAILLTMILSWLTMPHTLLVVLLVLAGFFTGTYILSYSISHNIVAAGAKSTSIGFTNTLAVATAPIMQPFVGYLLDWVAGGEQHTIADFQLALGLLPICLLVSAICALFLPTANRTASL
jgi:MFS family permease